MIISKKSKVYLAGHRGMVGSAIYKKLIAKGYKNIITQTRKKLNLLDQNKTFKFLKKHKPHLVIIAAAKVGGIISNTRSKDKFLYENVQIQNNLIHGSFTSGVKKFNFTRIKLYLPKKL